MRNFFPFFLCLQGMYESWGNPNVILFIRFCLELPPVWNYPNFLQCVSEFDPYLGSRRTEKIGELAAVFDSATLHEGDGALRTDGGREGWWDRRHVVDGEINSPPAPKTPDLQDKGPHRSQQTFETAYPGTPNTERNHELNTSHELYISLLYLWILHLYISLKILREKKHLV